MASLAREKRMRKRAEEEDLEEVRSSGLGFACDPYDAKALCFQAAFEYHRVRKEQAMTS